MSKIEVDKIIPQSGIALQVGENNDVINVPSGATLNINSGANITNNGTASGFDTDTNDKVRISANDTTASFLNGKLIAGTNISLTEGNDGGNETLTAAFSGNLNASVINAGTIATARLGTGTASSSTFLRGDQTYAALPAGGLEVANSWYVSSDTSASSNTETKIIAFASQSTGTGTVFSNSSGTFTAPSTGIYLAISSFACYASGSKFFPYIVSRIKKGGAVRATSQNAIYSEGSGNRWCQLVTAAILDITNTGSDTVTFHFQPAGNNANVENGNTSQVYFIKLADT
jgi:hypothetical protein